MQKQDLNLDFTVLPTLLASGGLEPLQVETLPEHRFPSGQLTRAHQNSGPALFSTASGSVRPDS